VFIHGSATDNNGCEEIDDVATNSLWNVGFQRSNVPNGLFCTPDDENCYFDTEIDDDLTGCVPGGADLTLDYEMDFDVQYFADATDAGSAPDNSVADWFAFVFVTDDNGGFGFSGGATTEINTLAALDVTTPTAYGTIALGGESPEQTITITNTGNTDELDPTIEQTADWVCTPIGTIDKGQVHWNTTAVQGYGAGTAVTASAVDLNDMSIDKFGGTATGEVFTILTLPADGISGSCSSTLTFTAVAGAAFVPTDVSGLTLWLDAADESTFTITSQPDIDTWADQSGNNNDVTQGSASLKPDTGGSIGGKNAVVFDGSDDVLKNSTAGGVFVGTKGILFAVVQPAVISADLSSSTIIAGSDEALGDTFSLYSDFGVSTPFMGALSDISSALDVNQGRDTTIIVSTAFLLTFSSNDTAYTFRIDGTESALTNVSGTDSGEWFGDIAARDNFTIGGTISDSSVRFGNFSIGEIIYYDDVTLTSQELADVEDYLANKWFISLP